MSEISLSLKAEVTERAHGCCEYCLSQAQFSPDPFSIEHIMPRSQGGLSDFLNLALSCQGCNNRKYNHVKGRDPLNGELVPLYHPRYQNWEEQFTWNEDFTIVIGLTSMGRATIEKLQLNRVGIVNLRRVLGAINQHPPHNN
jgi:HNH endonuclease